MSGLLCLIGWHRWKWHEPTRHECTRTHNDMYGVLIEMPTPHHWTEHRQRAECVSCHRVKQIIL